MDSLPEDKKLHLKSFATASNNNKPTKGQTCILFVISNKLHTDLRINKDSVQSNSNAKRPGYSHQMDWNPITVKDI